MNRMTQMVELLPARRRAEEFARALDGQRASVPQQLEPLLATVDRLAGVPLVEPRADFGESLRRRLLEAAVVELGATPAPYPAPSPKHVVADGPGLRRRRRLMAAATGLVLVGGGTGVAAASQQALPGEMLYPVKRTVENTEVALADGARGEGRALLERAATRLDEAQTLGSDASLTEVDLDVIDSALADFRADAAGGGDRLLTSYSTSGSPADLRAIRDFTAQSHDALSDLTQTLPNGALPELKAAAEAVVALDQLAVQACPNCTSALPPLDLPTMLVSLPAPAAANSSPDATTSPTLEVSDNGEPARRPAGREHENRQRQGSTAGSGEPGGVASDVRLREPGVVAPTDAVEPSSAPSQGDGTGATGGPLDGLLGGTSDKPSRSPRSVDAPGPADVKDLTDPLLDGTGDLVDGVL